MHAVASCPCSFSTWKTHTESSRRKQTDDKMALMNETLSIRTGEVGFIIFSVTNPGSYTHQLLNYATADVDGVVLDAAPVRLHTLYLRGPGGRFRDRRRTRDRSIDRPIPSGWLRGQFKAQKKKQAGQLA